MKVRAIPSTESVKLVLTERIGEEARLLEAEELEYEKLTGTNQAIYNPYHDVTVDRLRSNLTRRKDYLTARRLELSLLEAHDSPKIAVEFEL